MDALATTLTSQLAREETDALPLIRTALSGAEWKAAERRIAQTPSPSTGAEFFALMLDGTPPDRVAAVLAGLPRRCDSSTARPGNPATARFRWRQRHPLRTTAQLIVHNGKFCPASRRNVRHAVAHTKSAFGMYGWMIFAHATWLRMSSTCSLPALRPPLPPGRL